MYFWEDLLRECNESLSVLDPENSGIQRRQLFEDIRFMESEQGWAILLERNHYGRRVFYRYSDISYSINNHPLSHTEAQQIRSALQIFSRLSGAPQFEWINELIPRLESRFGLIDQKGELIRFDSNLDLKGINFLPILFNTILNERVLKILYRDFKSELPYEVTIHPHFLRQYNNRWFLLGLNEENNIPNWTLALDRIESLEETISIFNPSDIDWDEYFYDLIGVTRPKGVSLQEIILNFSPEVAPYILTKPLHPTQKHKYSPEGIEVKIKVIPNYELEVLILSFGENVKVVFPEDLKLRIVKRLNSASNLYK